MDPADLFFGGAAVGMSGRSAGNVETSLIADAMVVSSSSTSRVGDTAFRGATLAVGTSVGLNVMSSAVASGAGHDNRMSGWDTSCTGATLAVGTSRGSNVMSSPLAPGAGYDHKMSEWDTSFTGATLAVGTSVGINARSSAVASSGGDDNKMSDSWANVSGGS